MFSRIHTLRAIFEVWGIPTAVVLVGLASFGLGRLSIVEEMRSPVTTQKASAIEAVSSIHIGGLIVASKNGSAYYFPWCAGAQKISEQNKRWFTDEEGARKAGYKPAKNCKGLE